MQDLELALLEFLDECHKTDQVKELKQLEEKFTCDHQIMLLLSQYHQLLDEYNAAKKHNYQLDQASLEKMASLKKRIDENETIMAYRQSHKQVNQQIKKMVGIMLDGVVTVE